jgi:hypothetical protein
MHHTEVSGKHHILLALCPGNNLWYLLPAFETQTLQSVASGDIDCAIVIQL